MASQTLETGCIGLRTMISTDELSEPTSLMEATGVHCLKGLSPSMTSQWYILSDNPVVSDFIMTSQWYILSDNPVVSDFIMTSQWYILSDNSLVSDFTIKVYAFIGCLSYIRCLSYFRNISGQPGQPVLLITNN